MMVLSHLNQLTVDGFAFYVFWGAMALGVLGAGDVVAEWVRRRRYKGRKELWQVLYEKGRKQR